MSADLDRAIAEKVMGWASIFAEIEVEERRFNPSVNIADAWRVVERMRVLGFGFSLGDLSAEPGCEVEFDIWHPSGDVVFVSGIVVLEKGREPEAVCRAALAALEDQRKKAGQ